MRFRFTPTLALGLTIVMIGGCSCGKRSRVPLLAKLSGGLIRSNCDCEVGPTTCSCVAGPESHLSVPEPWYSGQPVQVQPGTKMQNTVAPPEPNEQPAQPPIEQSPIEQSPSNQSPIEQPEVPKPPSHDLKNGIESPELPELKRADQPDGDSTSSFAPSQWQSSRSDSSQPQWGESNSSDMIDVENEVDDLLLRNNGNSQDYLTQQPPVIDPSAFSSLSGSTHSDNATTEYPLPVGADDQVVPDVFDDSMERSPKIKATPVSTSKSLLPPREHQTLERDNDDEAGSESIRLDISPAKSEALPAKAFGKTIPIVLKAIPGENDAIQEDRVADLRGGGLLSQPNTDKLEIKGLPKLEGFDGDDRPLDFSGSDNSTDEPPANNRILGIEQVPHFEPLPSLEFGPDGLTTPTSFQVPWENDTSVLLDVASAIDCGLVDSDLDSPHQHNSQTQLGAMADWSSPRATARIIDRSEKHVQLLRLQASTALDRQTRVPPIVSILSTIDPVVVRSEHPDSVLPVVSSDVKIRRLQARPTTNQDPIAASVRGLSSRPSLGQPVPNTIDR